MRNPFQRQSRGKESKPKGRRRRTEARLLLLAASASLVALPASSWPQAASQQGHALATAAAATHAALSGPAAPGTKASANAVPLGAPPPAGKMWHVVADDLFDHDDAVNQTLWNGGTGGGMPQGFCGTEATSCGYTGKDCESYFGTYPAPPYAAVERGLGLAIQATRAAPGDNKYSDNQMADIQSYGKITLHPGSFVEWEAKMPTDLDGEGDGWHIDLWCSTLSRHRCDNSSEVDVAEKVLSKANSSKANYAVHDQPEGVHSVIETSYAAPGAGDLSAAFHTYGLFWRDDHLGKEGSFQAYIDGKPIVDHAAPVNDPSWESGAYCYAGWMQQALEVWGGGAAITAKTSANDPLVIKRFTVWQAR
jgi:hypothetical protein